MAVLNRTIAFAAGLALTVVSWAPVLAGSDNYDAAADTEGKGPAYFGFVRDTRGQPVSEAKVVLQPKAGDPIVLKSNVLGLYRSHVSKEAKPVDVQVTCEKDGYKQSAVVRRNRSASGDMFIETNCTLQRL